MLVVSEERTTRRVVLFCPSHRRTPVARYPTKSRRRGWADEQTAKRAITEDEPVFGGPAFVNEPFGPKLGFDLGLPTAGERLGLSVLVTPYRPTIAIELYRDHPIDDASRSSFGRRSFRLRWSPYCETRWPFRGLRSPGRPFCEGCTKEARGPWSSRSGRASSFYDSDAHRQAIGRSR